MAPCPTTSTHTQHQPIRFTLKTKYQKRPKIACPVCDLFGIARVGTNGAPVVRPHKVVDGKLCKGSGRSGFAITEQEWVRRQANYRTDKIDMCGNCAHRIPRDSYINREFRCTILNQAVHSTNVCKHHKPS